jgi:hypothetical protein
MPTSKKSTRPSGISLCRLHPWPRPSARDRRQSGIRTPGRPDRRIAHKSVLRQSVGNALIRYFPASQLLRCVGTRQAQPSACGIRDYKGHAVSAGASGVGRFRCCRRPRRAPTDPPLLSCSPRNSRLVYSDTVSRMAKRNVVDVKGCLSGEHKPPHIVGEYQLPLLPHPYMERSVPPARGRTFTGCTQTRYLRFGGWPDRVH